MQVSIGTGGVSVAGSAGSDSAEVQELKSEVNERKAEVKDLKGAVGTLRQQEAVGAPGAPAGGGTAPAPKTVGDARRHAAPLLEASSNGATGPARRGVKARTALLMAVGASIVGVLLGRRSGNSN